MEISTLSALLTAILLVVPGYIFNRCKRRFAVYEEPPDWQHSLLSYLAHSLVLDAFWMVPFGLFHGLPAHLLTVDTSLAVARELIATPAKWALAILVLPAVVGWLDAILLRNGAGQWLAKVVGKRGKVGAWVADRLVRPLPSIVRGWGAVYLRLTKEKHFLVIVTLKRGTTVAGIFGAASATSRSGAYPDLFLSQACAIDSSGTPVTVPDSRGIFIRGSEIVTLRLYEDSNAARIAQKVETPEVNHGQ